MCHYIAKDFFTWSDVTQQQNLYLGSCLKHLSVAFIWKLQNVIVQLFLKFPCDVTTTPHHLQKFPLSTTLLDLLLLTYPSVYFNSSQFYLIDTRTPLWNSSLFSSTLTHNLFFIFWRSSGASNLSALPKISPSSLTNNHNSSFNSRK